MAQKVRAIRFYCKKLTGDNAGKVYVLEQVTVAGTSDAEQTLKGPVQAEALLDMYKKTRGRIYPDYEVGYTVVEPISTIKAERPPMGTGATYTSASGLAGVLLGETVSAKMEFIPKKNPRREFPYSHLVLQPFHGSRPADTDGYWDPNPNYTTCFCFDFPITQMFRSVDNLTGVYQNVSGIVHIKDTATLSNAEIASKGFDLINNNHNGLYYSDDIEWRPQSDTVEA